MYKNFQSEILKGPTWDGKMLKWVFQVLSDYEILISALMHRIITYNIRLYSCPYQSHKFNVLLTVYRDNPYNKNQQDALFTFNLFQ